MRVVPDVPAGLPPPPASVRTSHRARSVTALRAGTPAPDARRRHRRRRAAGRRAEADDPAGPRRRRVRDDPVRDVHAADGSPGDERSIEALLDEVADHDTVVLGRGGEDPDSDDPRARIPAWEDIVFGVRRHR